MQCYARAARALITPVQQKLHEIDPTLPAFDVRTMEERVRLALSRSRFITAVLGVFAMIAFAIVASLLYGVTPTTYPRSRPSHC